MRTDFCAFILTHGRPDRVHTYKSIRRAGYTGRIVLVVDDEDKTRDEYVRRFGDEVVVFCKRDVAARIDEGDNFDDRRAIIYARNACFEIAKAIGVRYFIQLDDDYITYHNMNNGPQLAYNYKLIRTTMDDTLSEMVLLLESIPALSVAMSQGGDHIGGAEEGSDEKQATLRRKCMNSFVCSVDRPFQFFGRINEDVNTYTTLGRRGELFFTITQLKLVQKQTQTNSGGMTELYLDSGTYVKSFYSVMYSPSCVKVGILSDPRSPHPRLHHEINWHRTTPKILRESHRKVRA